MIQILCTLQDIVSVSKLFFFNEGVQHSLLVTITLIGYNERTIGDGQEHTQEHNFRPQV